jgi:hypothetical protein
MAVEIVLDCPLDTLDVWVRRHDGEGRQDKHEWEKEESAFHGSAPFEQVGVAFR